MSQSANSPPDGKKAISSYDPAPKSHMSAAAIGEDYNSTVQEVNKERVRRGRFRTNSLLNPKFSCSPLEEIVLSPHLRKRKENLFLIQKFL